VAFLVAVGLDALYVRHRPASSWLAVHRGAATVAATIAVALLAVVPVAVTYDVPVSVRPVNVPAYMRTAARTVPARTVMLTVPYAVSGVTQPMLWQAVDDMRFDLAGAALKTPGPGGGPVAKGTAGSARRIMTDLTISGAPEPSGTAAQIATLLRALRTWKVQQVVVAGSSRDPVYATGFLTMVLGIAPTEEAGAQIWTVRRGVPAATPALGASLSMCRQGAEAVPPAGRAAEMAHCVLAGAGRA
jgi:hypothetical protein